MSFFCLMLNPQNKLNTPSYMYEDTYIKNERNHFIEVFKCLTLTVLIGDTESIKEIL